MLMDFDELQDSEVGKAPRGGAHPGRVRLPAVTELGSDVSANVTETTEAGTCADPDSDDSHDKAAPADFGQNLYTQEKEPETEEERLIRQEIERHRFLIDVESEIMMQWRAEEDRELAERDGVSGVVIVINASTSKGAKVEKNFVDAVNEGICSCADILMSVVELEPLWKDFLHRLLVVTHLLSGLVHHRFRPQVAHCFQRFLDELVKPSTGIWGIVDRWRRIDKRRQARCFAEYGAKAERALANLVTQLERAVGHLVCSNPSTARKLSRAVAKLQELPQAAPDRFQLLDAGRLPPVDAGHALRVTLTAHRAAGEQVVSVGCETTAGELRGLLVEYGGLPHGTRLLYRVSTILGNRPTLTAKLQELEPGARLCDLSGPLGPHFQVSLPPELYDDSSDEEASAGPLKWLPDWPYPMVSVKSPILKVTSSSGTRLLAELRAAYEDKKFQREYKEIRRSGQSMEHVLKALSVQREILPKFGFEGTDAGVIMMRVHTSWWAQTHAPMAKLLKDIHSLLEYGRPLPKLPVVRGLAPPRFAPGDAAGWRRHLADEGFAVIAGVAGPQEVQQALELLWDFIEQSDMSGGVRRGNMNSWENVEHKFAGWPAGKQDGIIHTRGMGQSRLLWYLRGLPVLKRVFADLWGTQELVTSFDGAGVFRPYGHKPEWKTTKTNWFHVDQGHKKRGLHCVQGLVTLLDASERTGSLVVVPRSHRFHNDILSRYPTNGNGWNFVPLKPDDRILTEGDLGPRLIAAKAGDLIIWDSRTVHCNSPPLRESQLLRRRELLRAVAYICMTPAAWCSPAVLEERLDMLRCGATTSHWPHEVHPMTRYGRELAQEERQLKRHLEAGNVDELEAKLWLRKIEQHTKRIHDNAEACLAAANIASLIVPQEQLQDQPHQPGSASVLPEEEFKVDLREGVPLRRSPTTEWDEPVARLESGRYLQGHRFGQWVRLSSPPEGLDIEGELWACIDGERGVDGALRLVP